MGNELFRRRHEEADGSRPVPTTRCLADRPQSFLAGERVYLRPLLRTDLDNPDYVNAVMNPAAQAHTVAGMFPQNEAQMLRFWESLQPPDAANFAICLVNGDRHVGNILMRIDWISRVGEFGRLMFPGCGDAVCSDEAMSLLMAYAFHDLGLARLWGQGANPASVPSLVRLGFTLEGRLRHHVFRRGEPHDVFAFGILADEFEALRRGERPAPVPARRQPSAAVRAVVAEAFGVDPDSVRAETSPADMPRWDSFGTVRLWHLLEERFSVSIAPSDLVSVSCVGDIEALMAAKSAAT